MNDGNHLLINMLYKSLPLTNFTQEAPVFISRPTCCSSTYCYFLPLIRHGDYSSYALYVYLIKQNKNREADYI